MYEQTNLLWFQMINAAEGLSGWRLAAAIGVAEWTIALIPLSLIVLWMTGSAPNRRAAVRACLAVLCALALNQLIGLLWFHPRPFMAHVGHTFMLHAPDSSFPSDHATIILTVALVLAFGATHLARRCGGILFAVGICVAWARVYIGVHYPMDMIGAFAVSVAMALLAHTRQANGACILIVNLMETVYRRLLAAPIARGWLRP